MTVDTEVEGLSAYLGVQRARFGERLRTHIHVEHAAGGRRIASFLLQPLVENAVKYGRREDGLDVHIDIRAAGDVLHIQIENTGTLEEARRFAPAPVGHRPGERQAPSRPALSRPPRLHAGRQCRQGGGQAHAGG